jgi:ABC-type amino acid transport system permease subunit
VEQSVEAFAVIVIGVIGLSHLLQPAAWVEFFVFLRRRGNVGAFVEGLIHLPLAGFIIAFHNVWSGIPVILTLLGWFFLIKSLIRFCAPKLALKIMGRVSPERSWEFQVAGVGLLLFAGLLGYGAYNR